LFISVSRCSMVQDGRSWSASAARYRGEFAGSYRRLEPDANTYRCWPATVHFFAGPFLPFQPAGQGTLDYVPPLARHKF